MKRSIKTKLIIAMTSVVAGALIIGGALLIWQNTQQMRKEIYLDALTFAELTNDKIVLSFEQFYETENFLQFRKDLNPLLGKNVDISRIEIIGKSGETYYDSQTESDVSYVGDERKNSYDQDRARNIKPSLIFNDGEVVYTKKTATNEWVAVNDDEALREFPQGEVANIVFPHKNARLSIVYTLSYQALVDRVTQMAIGILAIVALSIILVSGFAIYLSGKLVRPIKILEQGVVKIGEGALGTQVNVDSDDEIGVLADTFNVMSKTLKKNTEELVEKEKLEKELDIAKQIQDNLLPLKDPDVKGLDISGSLKAATQIGGDIYDYLTIDKKGTYIFIADVTGHGVPAGMIANIAQSTLYSFTTVFEKTNEIMAAMNGVIHAKTKRNMFATALLTRWNEAKSSMNFTNAGHEQMILYEAEKKAVRLIGKGGMALGMIADLGKVLKEQEIIMKKGDILMLYTDGIPEAWRTEKENLGMERFQEFALKAAMENRDARSIREGVLKMVNTFRAEYPQQDDITLVVMRAK